MNLRTFSDEGIVLARRNFGEADRILSLYSKHHGRLSLIAKGVRKPQSKKRGSLEVFSYIKFAAAKGRSLDIITEAETIDSFAQVRKNLRKVAVAYFFMEVIGRTTREAERHQELFDLTIKYLNLLSSQTLLKTLRANFVYEVITTLGFWPKGRPLPDPDAQLEKVTERQLSSIRVGKKLVS